MICSNIKILIFVIFGAFLVKLASAFQPESIVGGFFVNDNNFTYQASIQGRPNLTNEYTQICAGGILDKYHILSAAFCVINETGQLIEQQFSVVVGTTNLNEKTIIRIKVEKIYLPGFDKEFAEYNLVVLKLKYKMPIQKNPKLSALLLPEPDEPLTEEGGVVAGFGYDWVRIKLIVATKRMGRIKGDSNNLLKYANVRIITNEKCKANYPEAFLKNQMCGVMLSAKDNDPWGICEGDAGTPLVTNKKVIGIAGKNPVNCDDSTKGCLYTKVSSFVKFINKVLSGKIDKTTIVFKNRRHIKKK